MMIRLLQVTTIAGLALGFSALAADKPATETKPAAAPPNMEEMMKKWQEIATPGAGHKALEPRVGEWTVESKMWMAGPDGPASESKGTAKIQWVLGGRFLREDFSGEMMQQKFQGVGTTGYDNFKKKYVGTWMDTMGTAIMYSEGTAEENGKVFTFTGKMDDAMTGEKDKPFKYILRITSPDKHTFEMHDLSLGAKSKVFEMTYTRKP